jgi:PAS domain S-box-containing protein
LGFETYFGIAPYENWYNVHVYPHEDGIAVYFQVITERKRTEESLRESEERLRNAQRIGKLGSLDWNLATNELLLSEETLAIFGLKKGKNIFAIEEIIPLLHPEDKQRVEKSLNDAIANKARHDLEHRIIRSDGEVIYVRAMAELFHDTDGKSLRLMGTIRNITDRKQAEAEKAELEAQNRQLQKAESLGRMAGAIAHHFNNQLYAVMGNLEMAMDDLPLGVNSNESLVSAMLAARKAAEVSRLMLTYLGQTPGKHVSIDLSEACRQSVTLLQAAVPKGTILNADFPSCGPIIHADSGQMHQILTNLVTNAWESISDNRGTIALTVKTVSHSDIPTSNRFSFDWQPQSLPYACLEVSDTGCGISNKDIEKLFDPFFTTKFTGRGLGLPVAMGIIKSHGGGVTVESEPERGSVFRVFFPVSTEELPIQHDLPAISEALLAGKAEKASKIEAGGTVLLIEDEEQVRKMAKIMLTRLGYCVLEAKDGFEALEIFQKHQHEISCVLSDLTMPRMNGWDTLAALRKISPEIPVILSSGYDEAQVMAGEHPELPNAFLEKPYHLKGLRDTISRVLANKAYGV